jgi:cytoskeletal protein CcmA (bactofilin family)
MTDETGTGGGLVFATSPTVTTLTVSSGGAAITGNSTVTGTLGVTSTINGQTISSSANFTGTLSVGGSAVCTVSSVCSGYANSSLSNISSTNLGAALNVTSGNLALQTTTSGNITLTPAYITGTLEVASNATFTSNLTVNTGQIILSGSQSASSWGTNGIGLRLLGAGSSVTYTNTSSTAGSTVAMQVAHAIGAPAFASTNAITVTDGATLYIAGGPTNGTNTNITNSWGLYVTGNAKVSSQIYSTDTVASGVVVGGTLNFTTNNVVTASTLCRSALGGSPTAWYTVGSCTSLAKYKDEVQNLPYGLETIRQLRPVKYKWNIDTKDYDTGFIAEEVNAVAPIFNEYTDGKLSGVRYDHMVSLAINGVKIIDEQVQAMEGRLAVLESGNLAQLHVTGDATIDGSLTVTGETSVQNITINGKIITAGSAPTIALGSEALGSGAFATVTGNDIAGTVSFSSGSVNLPTNTLGAGKQVEITFNKPYTNTPRVTLTPSSEAAAKVRYYVERTATGMIIKFADAQAENLDYIFDYQIMQ